MNRLLSVVFFVSVTFTESKVKVLASVARVPFPAGISGVLGFHSASLLVDRSHPFHHLLIHPSFIHLGHFARHPCSRIEAGRSFLFLEAFFAFLCRL